LEGEKQEAPMTHLPLSRTVEASRKPRERSARFAHAARSWFAVMSANDDFIIVGIFCAIGLLAAFNFILRFPDFGAIP
jgi:hypothetical protein